VFGLALAAFVFVDVVRRHRTQELNRVEATVLARTPGLGGNWSTGALTMAGRATAVVLVVMAVVTAIAVVRVGDSGAKAVWAGRLNTSAHGG
jgi:hypothetical protein